MEKINQSEDFEYVSEVELSSDSYIDILENLKHLIGGLGYKGTPIKRIIIELDNPGNNTLASGPPISMKMYTK